MCCLMKEDSFSGYRYSVCFKDDFYKYRDLNIRHEPNKEVNFGKIDDLLNINNGDAQNDSNENVQTNHPNVVDCEIQANNRYPERQHTVPKYTEDY